MLDELRVVPADARKSDPRWHEAIDLAERQYGREKGVRWNPSLTRAMARGALVDIRGR